MDLLQLKYFCDAAMCENFSETAKRHLVPPSNISQTVKRLERELGTPLFEREKNKIRLNDDGRAFYEKISRALEMIENAKNELIVLDSGEKKELKLIVLSNRRIVTEAIDLFRSSHPDVKFTISHRAEDADESCDVIISDDLSLAGKYERAPLINDRILLALDAEHPLAKKEVITANDLRAERFVSLNEGSSLYKTAKNIFFELGIEPNVVIKVDDPYYLRKYVSLGLGIAFIPEFSFRGQMPNDVVLRDIGDYRRKTYVFYKKERSGKGILADFLDTLSMLCEKQ